MCALHVQLRMCERSAVLLTAVPASARREMRTTVAGKVWPTTPTQFPEPMHSSRKDQTVGHSGSLPMFLRLPNLAGATERTALMRMCPHGTATHCSNHASALPSTPEEALEQALVTHV